jgi:hypothetical protein
MDPNPQHVFFVGQAGRLRRASAAAAALAVIAGESKLVHEGGGCAGTLHYVFVQVPAGSPAPLQARFSCSTPGTQSAQHNFVAGEWFFDTVIDDSEILYVQSELTTSLLVQVVTFRL